MPLGVPLIIDDIVASNFIKIGGLSYVEVILGGIIDQSGVLTGRNTFDIDFIDQ